MAPTGERLGGCRGASIGVKKALVLKVASVTKWGGDERGSEKWERGNVGWILVDVCIKRLSGLKGKLVCSSTLQEQYLRLHIFTWISKSVFKIMLHVL